MTRKVPKTVVFFLAATVLISLLPVTGCGSGNSGGKPKLMSFMGDSSQSAKEMKPVITELEKEYEGKVVFEEIDYDDPANKSILEEYHVTMNPTFIVLNSKGEIKETFMGKAHKEMLTGAIESYIPQDQKAPGTVPSTPGQVQTIPQSDTQGSIPIVPTPNQ
ncbi:MAG: thioredoxin family protein [Actinobacteria bacterium]|nr:thioredoxin family protein [Actinomycetota bacterium]